MKIQFVHSTARSDVPPAKARELIRQCNAAQAHYADKRRRRSARHEFDEVVQAELTAPALSNKPLAVIPCNISTHGAALLCRVFLNVSTRLSLSLPTIDGKALTVRGEIAHVRYVSDQFHVIGMKFDEPVDPEMFLGELDSEAKALDETGGSADLYLDLLRAVDQLKSEINRRSEPPTLKAAIERLLDLTERLEVACEQSAET